MKRVLPAVLAAALLASSASAVILWDQAPTAVTYVGSNTNTVAGSNWEDLATFSTAVQITRYVYFTNQNYGTSQTMRVKVLQNSAGVPGTQLHTQDVLATTWTQVFQVGSTFVFRVDLDLAPLVLSAGSYWFGAAGVNFEASQSRLNAAGGDSKSALFNGASFVQMQPGGDQAFQLVGSPVPEPGTMVLCGLALAAAARRRARKPLA